MTAEKQKKSKFWPFFINLSRGLAAFLALYSLLSLAAVAIFGAYNQNVWWINTGFLPHMVSVLTQIFLTGALGFFAVHVPQNLAARGAVAVPVCFGLFVAVFNTIDVYMLAASGAIILGFPLPFSFFVSVTFLCILISAFFGHSYLEKSRKPSKGSTFTTMSFTILVVFFLFPLGQINCFGTTDYRVKVDAAVVFGAQVYPSGVPSQTLQDRLDTAIEFHQEGFAPVLVMSGGIDAGGTNEAEAMRDYAIERGVAPEAIIIDQYGSTTQQTARNTVKSLQEAGFTKVATVSNFYHLARIKMLYLTEGMDVVTVPAKEVKSTAYPLFNVMREIPGWWYYWIQNLIK
ncbi:MAG: YdcF family protein [Coriobacteriia bacterium]|nr:YdcF family protein [Coriobacteriia bacterium]MCL2750014.1 YdcF family protein [Coriobacteriia bacterium]